MKLLHRFADASLRAENERLMDARDQARHTARVLWRRLQASREEVEELAMELLAERAPKETTK